MDLCRVIGPRPSGGGSMQPRVRRPLWRAAWATGGAVMAIACVDYPQDADPTNITYSTPNAGAGTAGHQPSVQPQQGDAGPPTSNAALVPVAITNDQDTLDRSSVYTTRILPGLNPRLCCDVPYGIVEAGKPVHLYLCTGDASAQGFVMQRGQLFIDGFDQGKNPSTLCMGLGSGGKAGSSPTLSSCPLDLGQAKASGQLWRWQRGMLQVEGTQLCLSLTKTTANANDDLALQPCTAGNAVLQWSLANSTNDAQGQATNLGVRLSLWRDPNVCMDIYRGSADDGTSVGIYQCHTSGSQRLVLQNRTLTYSGRCVSATGTAVGSGMELRGCQPPYANQQWDFIDGQLQLVGPSPSLCACTAGPNSPADQAVEPLQLLPCASGGSPSPDCIWTLGTRGQGR